MSKQTEEWEHHLGCLTRGIDLRVRLPEEVNLGMSDLQRFAIQTIIEQTADEIAGFVGDDIIAAGYLRSRINDNDDDS